MATRTTRDPKAPHGYDEEGNPLAPHGLKTDGTPRLSRRGALPGQSGVANGTARKKTPQLVGNASTAQTKAMLIDLADSLIAMPMVALSGMPLVRGKLGRHAESLAGDAVLVHAVAPQIADGMIIASASHPKMLSWLEGFSTKAPFVLLAQAGLTLAKAITENHLRPNPELNAAGRTMMQVHAARMVAAINAEAAEMGIDPGDLAQAA